MSVRHRTDGRADAAYCRIDRVGAIPVMLRDNDGFGFVSGAERREADAFYAPLTGRQPRPRQFGEAFAPPLPRLPLIERTPALEPLAEDPAPPCGFFGPGGAMRTLDQLRADIAQVAKDQWKAWHAGAVPRLEDDP